MRDEALKDLVLLEVQKGILLKAPVALLAIIAAAGEGLFSLSCHIVDVVWAEVVRIQQFVCQPTITPRLCSLDDRKGVASEENLREFLPHCCPVYEECVGEGSDHLCVRTNCGAHLEDGAPRYHLIIMRDIRAPDDTSRGIHCCCRRDKVRAEAV